MYAHTHTRYVYFTVILESEIYCNKKSVFVDSFRCSDAAFVSISASANRDDGEMQESRKQVSVLTT